MRDEKMLSMEKKKQLVIVQPMSDTLKKISDILTGIASDENITISMIDDLHELADFLAASGQCLVLVSNAKKCATILQASNESIVKFNIKTMLLTPQEIPEKTLIKFTKIGLTESLLESIAPKTLLYKIKLQLRSIKAKAAKQEEGDLAVKQLGFAAAVAKPAGDKEIQEAATTKFVADDSSVKKKFANSEESAIDYGRTMKGKIKSEVESIDTNWKSKRKTNEIELETDDTDNSDNQNNEPKEDIDLYYRGKRKKHDSLIDEESDHSKVKRLNNDEADTEDDRKKKKPSLIEEEEGDGFLAQLRLNLQKAKEMNDIEKSEQLSLEIIAFNKARKTALNNEAEVEEKARTEQTILELEAAAEKKRTTTAAEVLGGHYKGKISNTTLEIESEIEVDQKDNHDNTELELNPEKKIELDLIAASKKKKAMLDEAGETDGPHEGKVDHLSDDPMQGKGATDHIETYMGGKTTTSEGEIELAAAVESKRAVATLFKSEDEDLKKATIDLQLTPGEQADEKIKNEIEIADSLSRITSKNAEVQLSAEENKKQARANDTSETDKDAAISLELLPGSSDEHLNKSKNEIDDPHMNYKKSNNTELDLESGQKNKNKSQVDKIDTHYRGGVAKKKEQNWDNLIGPEQSVQLDLIKNRKADESLTAKQKNDLGEMTIDYRMLKKEFEMMERGEITGNNAFSYTGVNGQAAEADEESLGKVLEPEMRSVILGINIVNSLINKTVKPKEMFSLIAGDMLDNYNGYCVFYSYKQSDDKYTETYNCYTELVDQRITESKKEWWHEFRKSTELFKHYQSKSMSTWRSPAVIVNGELWEDLELPKWAKQELSDKPVELIFPYFDGLDKMGMALVFFPEGLSPDNELSILTSLELARALLLDTIQRYQKREERINLVEEEQIAPVAVKEKTNILGFLNGLFGRKKTG